MRRYRKLSGQGLAKGNRFVRSVPLDSVERLDIILSAIRVVTLGLSTMLAEATSGHRVTFPPGFGGER